MQRRRSRESRARVGRWLRIATLLGLIAVFSGAVAAEPSNLRPKKRGRSDIRDLLKLSSKVWDRFGGQDRRKSRLHAWKQDLDGFQNRTGVSSEVGGIVSGSGLGLGVTQILFADRDSVLGWQALSTHRGYRELRLFHGEGFDADGRLRLRSELRYRDLASERFYGTGMGSLGSSRSIFRSREFLARSELEFDATRSLTVSLRSDLENVSTSHPRNRTFGFGSVEGFGRSLLFAGAGAAVTWDTRDARYAREGSFVRFGAVHFAALSEAPSYQEFELDAQHAIRLPHHDHALVGRVGLVFRTHERDVELPFYLTRSVGGSRSLRGYSRHRFRGDDVAVVTVEYRSAVVSERLDAVVFWDAGGAYERLSELTLGSLRHSVGAGLRVLKNGGVLARLELAYGSEGTRVVLSFNAPF